VARPRWRGQSPEVDIEHLVGVPSRGRSRDGFVDDPPGCEPQMLLEALHDSPLASPYALAKLQKMLDEDFRPDFRWIGHLRILNSSESTPVSTPHRSAPRLPGVGAISLKVAPVAGRERRRHGTLRFGRNAPSIGGGVVDFYEAIAL